MASIIQAQGYPAGKCWCLDSLVSACSGKSFLESRVDLMKGRLGIWMAWSALLYHGHRVISFSNRDRSSQCMC